MTIQIISPIKTWANLILIFLSAALLILIFPGFDFPFLPWIALIPLFLLIKHSSRIRTFLSSIVVGLIFYSGLLWWMLRVDGFNPLNFTLLIFLNSIYLGVFGLSVHYFNRDIPQWNVTTFPIIWVIIEYLRSHIAFLSFPWGILGYSQYSVLPVARISAFTGVYGVSFLIITVNIALTEIINTYLVANRSSKLRGILPENRLGLPFGILVGVLILFLVSFSFRLQPLTEMVHSNTLKVALVQGNIYLFKTNDPSSRAAVFQKYYNFSMTAANSGPELITWPSSSVPGRIPYDVMLVRTLSNLARQTGAFLLVGSTGYDKFISGQKKAKGTANSAFLFTPQGKIIGRYDKVKLLPFDEYIPLRDYVKWPSWIVSPEKTDSKAGNKLTIFNMNHYKFGVMICWESLFPDLFRKLVNQGVNFMVSMTNEAFIDIPAAHYQMLAMNVFRAIENNVSIVRIATTGVSCLIEPTGRIIARVQEHHSKDVNIEGYLVGQISLSSTRTFYSRYGDFFIYFLIPILIGFFIFCMDKRKHIVKNGNGPKQ